MGVDRNLIYIVIFDFRAVLNFQTRNISSILNVSIYLSCLATTWAKWASGDRDLWPLAWPWQLAPPLWQGSPGRLARARRAARSFANGLPPSSTTEIERSRFFLSKRAAFRGSNKIKVVRVEIAREVATVGTLGARRSTLERAGLDDRCKLPESGARAASTTVGIPLNLENG